MLGCGYWTFGSPAQAIAEKGGGLQTNHPSVLVNVAGVYQIRRLSDGGLFWPGLNRVPSTRSSENIHGSLSMVGGVLDSLLEPHAHEGGGA